MVRVGIIGLGVGEAHLQAALAHAECSVQKICDIAKDRLESIGSKYGIERLTTNPSEVLSDPNIDLVSIASYDDAHCAQVVEAFANRKHVFVEKPVCLSPREGAEIREAYRKAQGCHLSSNLILRCSPRFRALKQRIDAGQLGPLYYLEGDYNYGRLQKITEGWRGSIDYSVVCGGGVHLVDLLLWLSGDRVTEVVGFGNKICSQGTKFKNNDLTSALLRFESGAVGKIACNFGCVQPHFHQVQLYGTKGTFVNQRERGLLYTSRDEKVAPTVMDEAYPGVHKGELFSNFVDHVSRGVPLIVPPDEVFRSMSVCFAIDEAIRNKQILPVAYL